MKKLALTLAFLSLSSLSSCVIAVGVPRDEWNDCEMQTCQECGGEVTCETCQAKQTKSTVRITN